MILGLSLKSVWMALFCRFQCHVVSARVCLCVSYLVIFYCQFIYCYLLESSVLSALNRMAFSNEKNLNGSFDGMHHTTRTHTHACIVCINKITHHVSFMWYYFCFDFQKKKKHTQHFEFEVNSLLFFLIMLYLLDHFICMMFNQ